MTWKSHIAFATAVTFPFNPSAIPLAVIGSTAPDWSETILKFFGIQVEHRGMTHYLSNPLAIIFISLFLDYHSFVFWFGIGYLTHWFCDALTITGVPLFPYTHHRVHFFGGVLRTGHIQEYILTFGLLFLSYSVFSNTHTKDGFNPYYIEFSKLYQDNVIDEKEYRDNKFKIF